jgi:Rhodopirellula transposase DDE domain
MNILGCLDRPTDGPYSLLIPNITIEIRIAHYPPYRSKYNPIEHLYSSAADSLILDLIKSLFLSWDRGFSIVIEISPVTGQSSILTRRHLGQN